MFFSVFCLLFFVFFFFSCLSELVPFINLVRKVGCCCFYTYISLMDGVFWINCVLCSDAMLDSFIPDSSRSMYQDEFQTVILYTLNKQTPPFVFFFSGVNNI